MEGLTNNLISRHIKKSKSENALLRDKYHRKHDILGFTDHIKNVKESCVLCREREM